MNNYENDVTIDPEALDVEWLRQPSLVYKYSRMVAEKQTEVTNCKEALEFIKASLDREIRKNPEKFEIDKMTEAAVSNTILVNSKYKKGMEEYLEAVYELNILKGVQDALNNKKTALENLVKLNGQNYFAGPSVPRDLTKEWERKEHDNEVNQGIASKMKRRN